MTQSVKAICIFQ